VDAFEPANLLLAMSVSTLGWWLCLAACGSVNQSEFTGEMAIHFIGLKNIDKPAVWVFPRIVVCLDCGTAEFAVPKAEPRQLVRAHSQLLGASR
jgi:hypothetical protein